MTFPIGPFHPTLTEPLALHLALRGERVTGVDIRMGYLYRGVEPLAGRQDLDTMLAMVEHSCDTCGAGYRMALSMALEQLAAVTPSSHAVGVRTIFAEVERALARLWLLQEVGRIGDFGSLLTHAVEAREILFEACTQATGHRLFWEIAVPGGIRPVADLAAIGEILEDLLVHLDEIDRMLTPRGVVGRATTQMGTITAAMAATMGLTGLALRASGADDDLRISDPYAAYAELTDMFAKPALVLTGDVASRLRLAAHDIRVSLACVQALLDQPGEGPDAVAFPTNAPVGEISIAFEATRGRAAIFARVEHAGQLSTAGWCDRLELHTPGEVNAGVIPIILNGAMLSDVPLILASLDVCVACTDL